MYQFRIVKLEDGGYRFELDDIKMLVSDYKILNDRHLLINPVRAFAYFTFDNNIYGISNETGHLDTAEAFYDTIRQHYLVFNDKNTASGGSNVLPIKPVVNNLGADNNTQFRHSA